MKKRFMRLKHELLRSSSLKTSRKIKSSCLSSNDYLIIMVESKTLLVTGGSGYIGSHTMVELLQGGMNGFTKIVIVDNLENSSKKVLDRIAEITNTELNH